MAAISATPSPAVSRREALAIILGSTAVAVSIAALVLMDQIEQRAPGCFEMWSDRSQSAYKWVAFSTPPLAAGLVFAASVVAFTRWWRFPLALLIAVGWFLIVGFLVLAAAWEMEGCV